jgi:hypothetical protein
MILCYYLATYFNEHIFLAIGVIMHFVFDRRFLVISFVFASFVSAYSLDIKKSSDVQKCKNK